MNIFDDIKELIFCDSSSGLDVYGEHSVKIRGFLSNPTSKTADQLFNFIHEITQKEPVFALLEDLKEYERSFVKILPKHKDHYIHSASVYTLGLALYRNSRRLQEAVLTQRHRRDDIPSQHSSFLFRWALAACLHDIAYPLEMSLKSFAGYYGKLNPKFGDQITVTVNKDIFYTLNLLPILGAQNENDACKRDTALGLIASNMAQRDNRLLFDTLLETLRRHIDNCFSRGITDHGAFSALLVLSRIHNLYRLNPTWDIRNFYHEVVDSATAIFLHTTYRWSPLKDIYGEGKLHIHTPSPLGFLLYLCDTMCEWMRGRDKKTLQEPDMFRLHIDGDAILFNINRRFRENIQRDASLIHESFPLRLNFI